MKKKKIKIKKCPCCHHDAIIYKWPYTVGFGEAWDIQCTNPNCTIQTNGYFESVEKALSVWNSRRRFFKKQSKQEVVLYE